MRQPRIWGFSGTASELRQIGFRGTDDAFLAIPPLPSYGTSS